ncbi:MAG: hypothetical protein R3F55_22905 [Alphaproteobacteria bacterium]
MDPRARFLSALALVAATGAYGRGAAAQDVAGQCFGDETQLYEQCLAADVPIAERILACTCFLQSFPLSPRAPEVVSQAVALGAQPDLAALEPAAGTPTPIY